ncbi:hypothetical protein FB451DRAFT_1086906, partial [Mycena latifolia]
MPLKPNIAQIRFNGISTCLSATIVTLEMVSDSLKTPFLHQISTTIRSLLTVVQTIRHNEDECIKMLEQINELLYAVLRLHITSDPPGELSPIMLSNLGRFIETLHKIHTFIEAQQEKSRIKQIFRQGEMSTLLRACHLGLEQAFEDFKLQRANMLNDIAEMQAYGQKTHQEILELISALSDGESSDRGSSISRVFSSSPSSSNSLSLLPSEPKIFHGHELEVATIIRTFEQEAPRIAILGAGGMGKTSLARAILHHPKIAGRYEQHRLFVACDTASNSAQLAALIGAHIGLNPGHDLTGSIIHHFASGPPSLLILDNLETIWEPRESRRDTENFMSLLTDVVHLALIITMRGAERPSNVRWSHPFLEPLRTLTQEAARSTFIDIADDGHVTEDIDKVLLLTDNVPLAIDLVAHLVDYEGLSSVLTRWEVEKTALLSEGHDKGSNLDLSISLSLESPRISSLPHVQDLLRTLSMLPDGVADLDLLHSKLPIDNILACKATLLRTSLAYTDEQGRLKALVPIREYVHKMHPPTADLVQPLVKHFQKLLGIYDISVGTVSGPGIMLRITSNFANIQSSLLEGLNLDNPNLVELIYSICHLDRYSRQTS